MVAPLIKEKSGIEIKPALYNLRLYSEVMMLIEDLRTGWKEGILRHLSTIKEIIKIISKSEYENALLEKYFPVGILTSEENLDINRLILYLRELSSSIEKGLIELGEYGGRTPTNKKVLYTYYEIGFIYPLEELTKGYVYVPGENRCIISVPHCHPPFHDIGTLIIGKEIAKSTNSHLIYSKLSRIYTDYNRRYSRLTPYRRIISKLIREQNIQLIIDVHGAKKDEIDIEIGYAFGATASQRTVNLLTKILENYGLTYKYQDVKFTGGDIIRYHSIVGRNEAIQLEISSHTRKEKKDEVVQAISKFIQTYSRMVTKQ